MKFTAKRRENMLALADKLESLPRRYKAFEMGVFLDEISDEETVRYAEHNGGIHECGAVACAIGHGPAAGILFPKPRKGSVLWQPSSHFDKNGKLVEGFMPDWHAYSARNFIDYQQNKSEWDWCFGGEWSNIDNHPWGAAARIRYLLDGNDPPQVEDYDGDMVPFHEGHVEKAHRRLYAKYRKGNRK